MWDWQIQLAFEGWPFEIYYSLIMSTNDYGEGHVEANLATD